MKRLGNSLKLVALSYQSYYLKDENIDQLGIFSTNHYYHEGEQRNWHWEDVESRIVLAIPIATGMSEGLEDKYKPASFSIKPDPSVERDVWYTDETVVWIGSNEKHFMTYGVLGYRLWEVLDIIPALRKLEPRVTITEEYPEQFERR